MKLRVRSHVMKEINVGNDGDSLPETQTAGSECRLLASDCIETNWSFDGVS